jgi:hypothetical protein
MLSVLWSQLLSVAKIVDIYQCNISRQTMADEDCEDRKKIFDTLINAGCCKRCALRYVGDTQTNYDDPEENINEVKYSMKCRKCTKQIDFLVIL